ncbi:hypothetical protein BDV28DRAFT_125936 [Aspergillus coremiiformis]|uniref:Uncharacterized protein n=1 Tax=Aspergillus coremiiformis TaxID=138285 RepID=A0A5N6ZH17_9EURO|nr:hypothetical protein BDV28DRAFT_125936 [Aspergillus coremiiformis]
MSIGAGCDGLLSASRLLHKSAEASHILLRSADIESSVHAPWPVMGRNDDGRVVRFS